MALSDLNRVERNEAGIAAVAMPAPDQPHRLRVESQDLERVGRTVFAAGIAVFGLVKETTSLEDTFFRMLDQDLDQPQEVAR